MKADLLDAILFDEGMGVDVAGRGDAAAARRGALASGAAVAYQLEPGPMLAQFRSQLPKKDRDAIADNALNLLARTLDGVPGLPGWIEAILGLPGPRGWRDRLFGRCGRWYVRRLMVGFLEPDVTSR